MAKLLRAAATTMGSARFRLWLKDSHTSRCLRGGDHTVLLRSDCSAVACGMNDDGECNVPQLDGEVSYLQVSAGICHTVLLRSDGLAAACGLNLEGQCDIPTPEPLNGYTWDHSHMPLGRDLVLQLGYIREDKHMLTCSNLAGHEMLRLSTSGSDLAWHTQKRIAHELLVNLRSLRVVLPDGRLLGLCSVRQSIGHNFGFDLNTMQKRSMVSSFEYA